jgi:hypothetical protein
MKAAKLAKTNDNIFWTSPLEISFDFTPEDPLALDYIAQQIGLWLFPGLTSRTSRAGYYPMVIYGLKLCEDAIEKYGLSRRDRAILDLFEIWERFWALAITHYHYGEVPSEDVMRGVRGVSRAYDNMRSSLSLNYTLLSRQLELGALGAYLSSLRHYRLIEQGGYRPTPLGLEIADSFWFEMDENIQKKVYHSFALKAMDPKRKSIPEKFGILTLRGLGKMSRLSRIRDRSKMQTRFWNILFQENRDGTTLPLTKVIVEANRKDVTDAKEILGGILGKRWKTPIEPDLMNLVDLAYHCGELMSTLRFLFDNLFKTAVEHGYVINAKEIIPIWLTPKRTKNLNRKIKNLVNSPSFSRLASLPMHGAAFIKFLRQISRSQPKVILAELVRLHDLIQRERTRGRGWLKIQDGKVIVELTSYRAWKDTDEKWMNDFRIGPLRSILADLGKI